MTVLDTAYFNFINFCFLDFMLKEHEDDTKSFQIIVKVYDTLILHHGVHWDDFNLRWKTKNTLKKFLADKVTLKFYLFVDLFEIDA